MPTTLPVRERIRSHYNQLTKSERIFANMLLEDYPAAGVASITKVAERAGVSTPTIARFVQKIGFSGYPAFNAALFAELQAKVSDLAERRQNWASEAPETHVLNRFATSVTQNIETTFTNIDRHSFDQAAQILANGDATLYLVGGRITRALADYAFNHLQTGRPNIVYLPPSSATWPHYLIDMQPGDTLLMFDVRRYEDKLMRLAEMACDRQAQVILITDQWQSPIAAIAQHTFACWIEIPSPWDSNVAPLMLIEALISASQEQNWDTVQSRFTALDDMFEAGRLFYKPKG